jgi:hypothetical protein
MGTETPAKGRGARWWPDFTPKAGCQQVFGRLPGCGKQAAFKGSDYRNAAISPKGESFEFAGGPASGRMNALLVCFFVDQRFEQVQDRGSALRIFD